MDLVRKAIELASVAHQKQKRKGAGGAYVQHPLRVADLLKREGASEEVVAAAVLHDVKEDQSEFWAESKDEFPSRVQKLVDLLTKAEGATKSSAVEKASSDKDAILIKMADRLDNFSDKTEFAKSYYSRKSVQKSTQLLLDYAEQLGLDNTQIYKHLKNMMEQGIN
jgi:(p)ppGpp synthase/HD superfamily hydrolase